MKNTKLNVRMSDRRLNKLRLYAASRDKTVTQIVEDWVDRLPDINIHKNSTAPRSQQPMVDID